MDTISKAIENARVTLPTVECRPYELMKNHTSFRIGGPVRVMFIPRTATEIMELCRLLHGFDIRPLITGNGTNMLVDDSGLLEIIVIKMTEIDSVKQTGDTEITAGAGISLSRLAVFACNCGLSGLECAHGIPGSLGGAVKMNAGAYGWETKDVVHSTSAFGYDGIYTVADGEHAFAYRCSRFSNISDIILSSTVRLKKADRTDIGTKMEELRARRFESQPLEMPSAGSTFKRPKSGYAAELIEQAGLKGFSIGGAQVSMKHSGFITSSGGATFSDVMGVIEHVKAAVLKQFGVELELEIKIISSQ